MPYDFSRLTETQQVILTFQGWRVGMCYPGGMPWPQPSARTVKKLIDRGLVLERRRSMPMGPLVGTVLEYEVPLDVHAAWCAHCASKELA